MATLEIFDVEHGACALLTADNGSRLMIDCGQNASSGWSPGDCLRARRVTHLEMLAITNYDEDHARGAPNLFDSVTVGSIWRNKTVDPDTILFLKEQYGAGAGIQRLVQEFKGYTASFSSLSPAPTFAGVTRESFQCSYDALGRWPGFDDENNLSMVVFLKIHGVGVMFTGDIEANGAMDVLLRDPAFRQALTQTQIYIAPHHGRESGCSDEAAKFLTNVLFVIISDKGHVHETQQTNAHYAAIAKGTSFRTQTFRKVLTTRNDGPINLEFAPGTWRVF